mmetsp:Transcript_30516/g.101472  ORF Transcript_30516/g.101472 Transcript_30516/m.101472 type:complete len:249 (+) Transcript_30516:1916-2662(+)
MLPRHTRPRPQSPARASASTSLALRPCLGKSTGLRPAGLKPSTSNSASSRSSNTADLKLFGSSRIADSGVCQVSPARVGKPRGPTCWPHLTGCWEACARDGCRVLLPSGLPAGREFDARDAVAPGCFEVPSQMSSPQASPSGAEDLRKGSSQPSQAGNTPDKLRSKSSRPQAVAHCSGPSMLPLARRGVHRSPPPCCMRLYISAGASVAAAAAAAAPVPALTAPCMAAPNISDSDVPGWASSNGELES